MWKLAAASLAFLVALYGQTSLPEGPGSDLAYAKCRPCHAMDVVKQSAGISRSMWARVVEEMKDFGMVITASEHAELHSGILRDRMRWAPGACDRTRGGHAR